MSPSNFIFTIIFLSTIVIDVNIIGTAGQENGSDEGNLNGMSGMNGTEFADNLEIKCDDDQPELKQELTLEHKEIYEKCLANSGKADEFLNKTIEANNDGSFWFFWFCTKTTFSNDINELKESIQICKQSQQEYLNEGAKNGSDYGKLCAVKNLAKAKKENGELKKKIDELKFGMANLKKENAELKKEIAELKKENAELTDGMSKMNVELSKMNEEMKEEFIKKQKEIDELKAKNEEFNKIMEEERKILEHAPAAGGNSSEFEERAAVE